MRLHSDFKISVCLASFNGGGYIFEQIKSILVQLKENDELIISDDGSTDATLSIISLFQDSRIRLVQGPRQGLVKNFEYALSEAKGDIIFLSDQDDIWVNGKVDKCLDALVLANADMVVTDCFVVDKDMNPVAMSFFNLRQSGCGVFKNLIKNSYLGCCIAFRRHILDISTPFPNNIPMHDWWLGLVAESFGKVIFLNEPLIYFRRHVQNASCTANVSNFSIKEKMLHRYALILNLCLLTLRFAMASFKAWISKISFFVNFKN